MLLLPPRRIINKVKSVAAIAINIIVIKSPRPLGNIDPDEPDQTSVAEQSTTLPHNSGTPM